MQHLMASDCRLYSYPPEKIYEVLSDIPGYAKWWPWGVRVKKIEQSLDRIGDKIEVWASGGWFRCSVNDLRPNERVEIVYYAGVVLGETYWTITPQEDGSTRVCYTIDVELNGLLPKLMGVVIDFSAIHSFQFKRVLACLDNYLRRTN
ncbi:type II toxin-antitoxin system RatA family toxin [Desulfitobacterium metallireducens]|uniref:Oligoketide cyclase n=1 Tax=Desulfitobacterium metallireducens DSM 15288 TaxID=871968 RepID=W0EBB4_9FIRM|nr:SRPBCC family protein [Desulfitobacterium metallireducens]AHF06813.1 oligoketide cyclase [Desulfitobacterium metallireducens DSM 15288]